MNDIKITDALTISVSACEYWNDTKIYVHEGECYYFAALGLWKDLFHRYDANGYTTAYMRLYDRLKRAPDHLWFALMGSVDHANHFHVGTSRIWTAPVSGRLSFWANDVKGFYWNNSGAVRLTISRVS